MYVLAFQVPLFFSYTVKKNSPILCKLFWPTSFLWQQLLEMFLMFTILQFYKFTIF